MPIMGRLDGKVALISGAARGQGAAEARPFVAEGAQVMLGDVLDGDGGSVAKELGDRAAYCHHNVTREADWAAIVEATTSASEVTRIWKASSASKPSTAQ